MTRGVRAADGIELVTTPEHGLARAHFISPHLPLSPETYHLVDEQRIAQMRQAPLLVNTSRWWSDAVMRGLDDGRLSGVALDVTGPEPLPPDHGLRTHERSSHRTWPYIRRKRNASCDA